MSRIYRTKDGDMLDAICFRELGSEKHTIDVLKANPGLADLGPVYPAGLSITLPEVSAPIAPARITLWGRA